MFVCVRERERDREIDGHIETIGGTEFVPKFSSSITKTHWIDISFYRHFLRGYYIEYFSTFKRRETTSKNISAMR